MIGSPDLREARHFQAIFVGPTSGPSAMSGVAGEMAAVRTSAASTSARASAAAIMMTLEGDLPDGFRTLAHGERLA